MFEVSKIRQDFPLLKKADSSVTPLIYLDNAATTLKPQAVIDAVLRYYTDYSVNIHRGDYDLSYQVSDYYEKTRRVISKFINSEVNEVVFTAGASASLNIVAYGYGEKYINEGDVILSTESEHASSILPWFRVASQKKAEIEYVPLTDSGELTIDNFRKAMHERVKVVVVAHISNVLGYIVPIKEITKIAHEYGAIVVVDGAQSVPHIPTDVKDWDIDFLAFSAHKMYGPTGVGVLYGKYNLLDSIEPYYLGGGSNARFDRCGNITLKNPPYKFEAGTPAIEAVLGFGAAIEYINSVGFDSIEKAEHDLREYLVKHLSSLPHIKLYNLSAKSGIVTLNVNGIPSQDVALYLNSKGIMVRAGNHCAKILLDVLKTPETVRISLSFYNTKEECDALIDALKDITLEKCIDLIF
jgi:cysteine desulfurase / selenocysteine lyase